jgi:hypothetical protein
MVRTITSACSLRYECMEMASTLYDVSKLSTKIDDDSSRRIRTGPPVAGNGVNRMKGASNNGYNTQIFRHDDIPSLTPSLPSPLVFALSLGLVPFQSTTTDRIMREANFLDWFRCCDMRANPGLRQVHGY